MTTSLRPLSCFPSDHRRLVRCVLTDIDDTLTIGGRLTASAFEAMESLAGADIAVVPVTGRPAGWCDQIARQWPVAGVVGENGAFYFSYDAAKRAVRRSYWFPEAHRARDRLRLDKLALEIREAVPRAGIASDQRYRESDLAIDWAEDVGPLSEGEINKIVEVAASAGATVRVSSIHINIWFGNFSKLEMAKRLGSEVLGLDPDAHPEKFVFVGDSPNDVTMFGFFPNSVGVANVLRFQGRLEAEPTYVTIGEGGDGFLEVAHALLEARSFSG